MNNIKIAVIGCGHWGKNLVRNFHELGALKAVHDPDQEIADRISKQYNVENKSFDLILNDPDISGVVIAAPAPLH